MCFCDRVCFCECQSSVSNFSVYIIEATIWTRFLKLAQSNCLNDISDEFSHGWVVVKKGVTRSILRILFTLCQGHLFGLILLKLCQNVCLFNISVNSDYGLGQVKSRSLGQILEKSCLHLT